VKHRKPADHRPDNLNRLSLLSLRIRIRGDAGTVDVPLLTILEIMIFGTKG